MTPDGTATNATAVQNELSMKRIELKSKYMSAIETSVLQVMMSSIGAGSLPGALVNPAGMAATEASLSEEALKQNRMATCQMLVESMDDELAIKILSQMGAMGSILDKGEKTIAATTSQLPAQYLMDSGTVVGFVGRCSEDGWCVLNAFAGALTGSEAFAVPLLFYLIQQSPLESSKVYDAEGGETTYLSFVREDLIGRELIQPDADDVDVLSAHWAQIIDVDNKDYMLSLLELMMLATNLKVRCNVLAAENQGSYIEVSHHMHVGLEEDDTEARYAVWLVYWAPEDESPIGHFDYFTKGGVYPLPAVKTASRRSQLMQALPSPSKKPSCVLPPPVVQKAFPSLPPPTPFVSNVPAVGVVHSPVLGMKVPSAPPQQVVPEPKTGLMQAPGLKLPDDTGGFKTPQSHFNLSPAGSAGTGDDSLLGVDSQDPHLSIRQDVGADGTRVPSLLPLEKAALDAYVDAALLRAGVGSAQPVRYDRNVVDEKGVLVPVVFPAPKHDFDRSKERHVALGNMAPRSLADAGVPEDVDDGTGVSFWTKVQAKMAESQSVTSTQYTLLGSSQELTHQQLQQVKGLQPLENAPKLQLTTTFSGGDIRTTHAWFEACVQKIVVSYPAKGGLLLSFFNYSVSVYSELLDMDLSSRDVVLASFKSKVADLDLLNQALARKWTTFLIEGLPKHIRDRLWMQKTGWTSRLLGPASGMQMLAADCLNLHEMNSPLCTPDGVMLTTLVSMFDNVGNKRLKLQEFVCGVPPCTIQTFTVKFDAWVSLIHAVRTLGVRLPDASMLWASFGRFVSKLLEESAVLRHYMTEVQLREASRPILASDETRVLQLIQETATRIAGLVDVGTIVSPQAKAKAKAAPEPPQLLQAKAKGAKGKGKGKGEGKAAPKPAPAPKAPAAGAETKGKGVGKGAGTGGAPRIDVCCRWVENNGTCPDNANCRHAGGHVLPITDAMRESCQRIIAARARNIAKGKGRGGRPQGRQFNVFGWMMAGGPRSKAQARPLPDPVDAPRDVHPQESCTIGGCSRCNSPILQPRDVPADLCVDNPADAFSSLPTQQSQSTVHFDVTNPPPWWTQNRERRRLRVPPKAPPAVFPSMPTQQSQPPYSIEASLLEPPRSMVSRQDVQTVPRDKAPPSSPETEPAPDLSIPVAHVQQDARVRTRSPGAARSSPGLLQGPMLHAEIPVSQHVAQQFPRACAVLQEIVDERDDLVASCCSRIRKLEACCVTPTGGVPIQGTLGTVSLPLPHYDAVPEAFLCREVYHACLDADPTITEAQVMILARRYGLPRNGIHAPGEHCFRDFCERNKRNIVPSPAQFMRLNEWLADDDDEWKQVGTVLYILNHGGPGGRFRLMPDQATEPAHALLIEFYGPPPFSFAQQFRDRHLAQYDAQLAPGPENRLLSLERFIENEWVQYAQQLYGLSEDRKQQFYRDYPQAYRLGALPYRRQPAIHAEVVGMPLPLQAAPSAPFEPAFWDEAVQRFDPRPGNDVDAAYNQVYMDMQRGVHAALFPPTEDENYVPGFTHQTLLNVGYVDDPVVQMPVERPAHAPGLTEQTGWLDTEDNSVYPPVPVPINSPIHVCGHCGKVQGMFVPSQQHVICGDCGQLRCSHLAADHSLYRLGPGRPNAVRSLCGPCPHAAADAGVPLTSTLLRTRSPSPDSQSDAQFLSAFPRGFLSRGL